MQSRVGVMWLLFKKTTNIWRAVHYPILTLRENVTERHNLSAGGHFQWQQVTAFHAITMVSLQDLQPLLGCAVHIPGNGLTDVDSRHINYYVCHHFYQLLELRQHSFKSVSFNLTGQSLTVLMVSWVGACLSTVTLRQFTASMSGLSTRMLG